MDSLTNEYKKKENDKRPTGKRRPKKTNLVKQTYEEKVIQLKRVTKVVKGGKKMTFRAVVIIGDKKRMVGVGVGRADDINVAIDKAILNGKKNLISVPLTRQSSIPHIVQYSSGASSLLLRPASKGSGVIAGGSVRTVLELAGIKNVLAKQFGSQNILNNAKSTIQALISLNETIELGKNRTTKKRAFYGKIMKREQDSFFSV